MMIPIPSNHQRFTLTLGIEAYEPLSTGIVLYDPSVPYSDYMRRKVTFRSRAFRGGNSAYREIHIPVPISPMNLVLEVYNKRTQDADGFNVTDFAVNAMPSAQVWASEARHRFMDFAIRFAQKAGYVQTGFYHSPDHEFLIQYLPAITDGMGNELVTPARIHRQMPRVQLSQRLFQHYTIPVRVAILSHEGCHFFMNTRSERNADLCGLQYYLDYGFPTIEAVYAATHVFGQMGSVGKAHVNRAADIMAFIDRYKALHPLKYAS